MDFWDVVQERYSVRDFDPSAEVSPEDLNAVLEAAIRSPSAGNCQAWHFYVVRDPELREGLVGAAYGQQYISQAPVAIVVCADAQQSAERYAQRGRELYCLQDTASAIAHILLAAVALGLGSCWIGAFDEARAARVLNLPVRHRPVAIVPIGKPAKKPAVRTPRNPLNDVATFIG